MTERKTKKTAPSRKAAAKKTGDQPSPRMLRPAQTPDELASLPVRDLVDDMQAVAVPVGDAYDPNLDGAVLMTGLACVGFGYGAQGDPVLRREDVPHARRVLQALPAMLAEARGRGGRDDVARPHAGRLRRSCRKRDEEGG